MPYNKNIWKPDDLITSEKLNNMEDGISNISNYNKDNPIRPTHWTTRYAPGQGSTVINGYWYVFTGTNSTVGEVQDVLTKDLTRGYYASGSYVDAPELGKITHNVGHANSVDFINNTISSQYNSMSTSSGYLAVGDGTVNDVPNLTLFENIDNSVTFFDTANATHIAFSEGTKKLSGWGGFCFAEDYKTLFYVRKSTAGVNTVTINKIALGTGTNDLSDTSEDKSDLTKWGTFVSNKADNQYNGTAEILSEYVIDTSEFEFNTQPQDMVFADNKLYVGTGSEGNHVFVYKVKNNDITLEQDLHPSATFTTGGETESVAIFQGRLYAAGGIDIRNTLAWEYPVTTNDRLPVNNEDKTIRGINTFQKPIVGSFSTRAATFSDLATVASKMITYSGNWFVKTNTIANTPVVNMTNYIIEVVPLSDEKSGYIKITNTTTTPIYYIGQVSGGIITGWTNY